jgi:ubiquitin-conjugating enzyme E2 J2
MLTPNGRFKTNTSLCLTITSFHPDSWNPSWSISSILNGFLSFMCDTSATFGSIETSYAQKRKFAYDSLAFNIQDPIFCELFPDITDEIKKIIEERTAKLSTLNPVNNDQEQSVVSSTLNSGSTSTSWFNNLIGNLMILALLAVFAIVVRFILNSTAEIQ